MDDRNSSKSTSPATTCYLTSRAACRTKTGAKEQEGRVQSRKACAALDSSYMVLQRTCREEGNWAHSCSSSSSFAASCPLSLFVPVRRVQWGPAFGMEGWGISVSPTAEAVECHQQFCRTEHVCSWLASQAIFQPFFPPQV